MVLHQRDGQPCDSLCERLRRHCHATQTSTPTQGTLHLRSPIGSQRQQSGGDHLLTTDSRKVERTRPYRSPAMPRGMVCMYRHHHENSGIHSPALTLMAKDCNHIMVLILLSGLRLVGYAATSHVTSSTHLQNSWVWAYQIST